MNARMDSSDTWDRASEEDEAVIFARVEREDLLAQELIQEDVVKGTVRKFSFDTLALTPFQCDEEASVETDGCSPHLSNVCHKCASVWESDDEEREGLKELVMRKMDGFARGFDQSIVLMNAEPLSRYSLAKSADRTRRVFEEVLSLAERWLVGMQLDLCAVGVSSPEGAVDLVKRVTHSVPIAVSNPLPLLLTCDSSARDARFPYVRVASMDPQSGMTPFPDCARLPLRRHAQQNSVTRTNIHRLVSQWTRILAETCDRENAEDEGVEEDPQDCALIVSISEPKCRSIDGRSATSPTFTVVDATGWRSCSSLTRTLASPLSVSEVTRLWEFSTSAAQRSVTCADAVRLFAFGVGHRTTCAIVCVFQHRATFHAWECAHDMLRLRETLQTTPVAATGVPKDERLPFWIAVLRENAALRRSLRAFETARGVATDVKSSSGNRNCVDVTSLAAAEIEAARQRIEDEQERLRSVARYQRLVDNEQCQWELTLNAVQQYLLQLPICNSQTALQPFDSIDAEVRTRVLEQRITLLEGCGRSEGKSWENQLGTDIAAFPLHGTADSSSSSSSKSGSGLAPLPICRRAASMPSACEAPHSVQSVLRELAEQNVQLRDEVWSLRSQLAWHNRLASRAQHRFGELRTLLLRDMEAEVVEVNCRTRHAGIGSVSPCSPDDSKKNRTHSSDLCASLRSQRLQLCAARVSYILQSLTQQSAESLESPL